MNVLHIADIELNKENGIKEIVFRLAVYQKKIGLNPSVLLLPQQEDILLDNTIRVKSNLNKENYQSLIKECKPDIVVFHSFYKPIYIYIYKYLNSLGIPFLIEPHGAFTSDNQKKGRLKKSIANLLLFNRFVKQSKGIIYNSTEERRTSIHDHASIFMIQNGVDQDNTFVINKTSVSPLRFIFLSRIDVMHKGIDFLVDAITSYDDVLATKDVVFDFYGGGNKKDVDFLTEATKNLKTPVKLHGSVFNEKKANAFQQGDIFILTSRYEGMPMAILEALSYGLPCLLTRRTNMAEVIEKNEAGWIADLSAEAIGKKILEAIDDYRQNTATLRGNARKAIETGFSWQLVAEKTAAAYKETLAGKK